MTETQVSKRMAKGSIESTRSARVRNNAAASGGNCRDFSSWRGPGTN